MKTRKGFTLIELMIVIAIIAIIAAIAIPNLLASRIRANEATAISGIKQIATAQVTFQAGKQGRVTANTDAGPAGFATNYRQLAFGLPVGETDKKVSLQLISDAIANAFIVAADLGPATTSVAATLGSSSPYQGYKFHNDPAISTKDTSTFGGYATNFAVFARPTNGGTTGNNDYWVGQQGVVKIKGVVANTAAAAPVAATGPLSTPADWSDL